MPEDADLDIDIDAELAGIQGAVAGLPDSGPASAMEGAVVAARTVPFMGRKFRVASKIGLMPLLKFSAFSDLEVQDARALGALYAMLKDCIDPADWRAFEDHACEAKAEADDLLDVVSKTIEMVAGRPTERPAASSRGPRGISAGSTGSSSARRGKGSRR